MNPTPEIKKEAKTPASTVYEIISYEGLEEMGRPLQSLAWSALVAGFLISFCLLCEAILKLYLPEGGSSFLIYNLGYSVGFVLVIIGRFQLFTENTITPILPVYDDFTRANIMKTARLWGVVITLNFIGAFLMAFLISFSPYVSDEMMGLMVSISEHAISNDFAKVFLLAVPAGFLIACLVWLIPSAKEGKIFLIFLVTYMIAVLDFAHVVAGSTEAFLLVLEGHIEVVDAASFLVAATLGNVFGGTCLFALVAYAQVQKELD